MKRPWLLVAVTIAVLAAVFWTPYLFVDRAYERLVAIRPADRQSLEAELRGFSGERLLDSSRMQQELAASLTGEREYWRYRRFGLAIDVVYEPDGSVYAMWPDYE